MAHKSVFKNNIVTPVGRLSFPKLAKPDTVGQYADNKYKTAILFPKDTDLKDLKKAVLECAKEAWPKKKLSLKELQHPFRNGDDKPELDGYEGCIFINCKTKKRPLCVDKSRKDMDPEEIYGGCHARLVVSACSYEQAGKCGVTFLLDIVQFVKDGPRFGGGGASVATLDDGTIDGGEDEDMVLDDDFDDDVKEGVLDDGDEDLFA